MAALALVVSLSALTAGAAMAQWPTTCVGLNDIVEAHLGNTENVGIYQRVFGDQAEAACQNDHRDDVRAVFAWAIGGDEPAMQPAPAAPPPAQPESAPDASMHPDYERVRQVALARGADEETAASLATSVINGGTVDAFLRGHDGSVVYGTFDCQYRSDACPQAPVKPDCQTQANLSGSRTDIQTVKLCPGTYRLDMTHEGSRNFAIWGHNLAGWLSTDLLVNKIGSGTWVKSITAGAHGCPI